MKFSLPDSLVGMGWGIVGGSTKFLMDIQASAASRSAKMFDACLIAVMSAMCGLFGKDLYLWIKSKIKKQI